MRVWERGTGGRVCFAPGGRDLVVEKLDRSEDSAALGPRLALARRAHQGRSHLDRGAARLGAGRVPRAGGPRDWPSPRSRPRRGHPADVHAQLDQRHSGGAARPRAPPRARPPRLLRRAPLHVRVLSAPFRGKSPAPRTCPSSCRRGTRRSNRWPGTVARSSCRPCRRRECSGLRRRSRSRWNWSPTPIPNWTRSPSRIPSLTLTLTLIPIPTRIRSRCPSSRRRWLRSRLRSTHRGCSMHRPSRRRPTRRRPSRGCPQRPRSGRRGSRLPPGPGLTRSTRASAQRAPSRAPCRYVTHSGLPSGDGRNREPEEGSVVRIRFHPHVSAVRLGEATDGREAKPDTASVGPQSHERVE